MKGAGSDTQSDSPEEEDLPMQPGYWHRKWTENHVPEGIGYYRLGNGGQSEDFTRSQAQYSTEFLLGLQIANAMNESDWPTEFSTVRGIFTDGEFLCGFE